MWYTNLNGKICNKFKIQAIGRSATSNREACWRDFWWLKIASAFGGYWQWQNFYYGKCYWKSATPNACDCTQQNIGGYIFTGTAHLGHNAKGLPQSRVTYTLGDFVPNRKYWQTWLIPSLCYFAANCMRHSVWPGRKAFPSANRW